MACGKKVLRSLEVQSLKDSLVWSYSTFLKNISSSPLVGNILSGPELKTGGIGELYKGEQ